ncbi:hypothetical protein LZA78_08045 [Sinirhodobacter sp. WL0062]|uniref:DUF4402 domain-containing protein n=1 Tax=Rhodobacter flavimaris TaxID=2907145 RepID=A0ABS8YXW4_9RHOB|nr:hypothetical protein [Sinirhodobacter sp. WL0062]MCE5973427.1 hypothetical protein [Sinirhodobacter sp. WL0062]
MKIAKLATVVLSSILLLAGCQEIEPSSTVKAGGVRVGDNLVAGRGDAVLEVVSQESLPNAFGGADVFGRTRPTGTTALIFISGTRSTATFLRRDVSISSQKTTMNSTPIMIGGNSQTYHTGNIGYLPYSGTSTTYRAPVFLPPNTPSDMITGVREITIRVPTRAGANSVSIAGHVLTVISASENQVTYTLQ